MDADAAPACSMLVVSMAAVTRRMGIQNFPIPFPIGLRMGGVSAEVGSWRSAKAVVSLLQARLPCGAGLEIPLFHEPAIASTILCNVAIIVFGQYVLMLRSQWRIYGNVQADVNILQAKKREKNPALFAQEPKKARGSPQTLKQTVLFGRRPDKGRPAKCLRTINLSQSETESSLF